MNPSINFFEELGMNAWPSSHSLFYDGWVLRLNEGFTQRANSVNPVYQGDSTATVEKIRFCEEFYTSRKLPTIFKLTPASFPADLDTILESQGYTRISPTAVQTVEMGGLAPLFKSALPDDKWEREGEMVRLVVEESLSADWLANWMTLNGTPLNRWAAVEKILANILPAHGFARLEQADRTLALGLAVCERGHVGLFNIVTNREFRRQGWGKRLVLELLKWGQEQGATTGYLQVSLDNEAALPLYAALGFREIYHYWYRVKSL